MGKYFIPDSDHDLLIWARNFAKCLEDNMAALKLDQRKVGDFVRLTEDYEIALKKAKDPDHIRTDIIAKNEKAKELRKSVRITVAENLRYNPWMTEELRQVMMLGSRSYGESGQTLLSKPRLEFTMAKARISASYHDEVSGRRAKPKGASMIEYAWALLDTAPLSVSELREKVLKTSGSLVLDFEERDRGKACYIAARWIGRHGETGPWSDIDKIYVG